ncbi:MAG: HlyD family type I secretion periplasmic adaptor subunit [Desulfuromonadales bacterium]|nr:HlyD family type I secretion periplasmic adaptor subunit [Desulfuromonadales bacterium]
MQQTTRTVDGNPRKFMVAGLVAIALFFGGLVIWSAFFPFAGAVIAPGVVKVTEERKIVQHLEGGIVEEILVHEGSRVAAGDLLIRLQSSAVDASADLVRSQLWARQALQARLEAESRMADRIHWPDELLASRHNADVDAAINKEEAVFASRRADLTGKLALHDAQIRQLEERIAGAHAELAAGENIAAALREELQAKEQLLAGRYIDMSQVLSLRRQLAEREGAGGSLQQAIAGMRQQIEELRLRKLDLENSYREKATTELSAATDEIVSLRERLRPALDSRARLEIRAPITGEVLALRIHSEQGGVVRPGEPLLEIVPQDAELTVEARIQPQDITRVRVGQETKVELSAFDRRLVSPLLGEVVHISADMLQEQTSVGAHSYYLVKVRVLPAELERQNVYLSPGMPAVCFITTEERTILGYLLEPLFFFLDRSLREG